MMTLERIPGRAFVRRAIKGGLMLNLLRFREIADYSANLELAPEVPISGAEAYDRYKSTLSRSSAQSPIDQRMEIVPFPLAQFTRFRSVASFIFCDALTCCRANRIGANTRFEIRVAIAALSDIWGDDKKEPTDSKSESCKLLCAIVLAMQATWRAA